MSVKGVMTVLKFDDDVEFEDEWLQRVYASLEANMAVVSIDSFIDENANSISFHLGIDFEPALVGDPDEFVVSISRDAISNAVNAANEDDEDSPIILEGRVAEFV